MALVALAVPAGLFAEPAWLGLHVWLSRYDIAVALPHHPPPRNDLEATLQDIADLKLLPEGDRSFSPEARSAFDHQADALAARAGSPPPPAFALDVARLVALAGNGHTTVNLVQRAARFGRAPLRFAWFAEGLFIVRATPAFADLLGRRVISIDGRPVDAAFAAVRPYFSGTEQRARAECPPLLESPPLLQVLWPDTDGRTLSLEIETQAADPKRRDLPVLAPVLDKLAGQRADMGVEILPVLVQQCDFVDKFVVNAAEFGRKRLRLEMLRGGLQRRERLVQAPRLDFLPRFGGREARLFRRGMRVAVRQRRRHRGKREEEGKISPHRPILCPPS